MWASIARLSYNRRVRARLFVIMAGRSPRAVILRRGPSPWSHVIRWNTSKDEFEHGAWFKGRIYEQRCDLSPDGELLLYFALKGSRWRTNYHGAWTAVSRAPWLHALALWPEGSTWGGGRRFVAEREIVLRSGGLTVHPDHPARGLKLSTGDCPTHASDGAVEGAEWSGRDHAGNAVFTRDGKLFRRVASRVVEIADFNPLKPEPEEAPAWAQRGL
jgi:hypothetical protein